MTEGLADLAHRAAGMLLAAPADNIPPEKGAEWGKAAPIGLLVILLLALSVFFLIRNMTKQIRKVPDHFDGEPEEPGDLPSEDAAPADDVEPSVDAAPAGAEPDAPGPVSR